MLISIIVPTYNQELYIGRCLRSLIDQSIHSNEYEIIVINDGSKDGTSEVLNLYKKDIEIITNKKNKGLPYSINKGISQARGRFIVRVDSDDYVNKDFLKVLEIFLSSNKAIDAVCCDYYLVNDKEEVIERKNASKYPIGCGILFRTEQLIKLGLYDETFEVHEDEDLRLRFLKDYKIHRVAVPLYRYRKHESNITNNKVNMLKHYKRLKKKHKIK